MKSLLHYWLLNMEQLDGNVAPFAEILAPDFQLNFSTSSAPMNSLAQLEEWLHGTPLSLSLSAHHPENFHVTDLGDDRYEVIVDFKWFGQTKDGQALKAVTAHNWKVVDNPNERFARIQEMTVEQKEALGPL